LRTEAIAVEDRWIQNFIDRLAGVVREVKHWISSESIAGYFEAEKRPPNWRPLIARKSPDVRPMLRCSLTSSPNGSKLWRYDYRTEESGGRTNGRPKTATMNTVGN
jgi:hypothetical protein